MLIYCVIFVQNLIILVTVLLISEVVSLRAMVVLGNTVSILPTSSRPQQFSVLVQTNTEEGES